MCLVILLYVYSPTEEVQYDTADKPSAKVVPHQSSASGVEYAVSASMASLNEQPPEYAYTAVDKKKVITTLS